ncbi:pathogenesis-related homeodomain protein-like [Abeliophyllum distichum]|uniref:Pathogenesis-related homeodomain protein-like n=1 Tax=Abeliophyllum distichum TaxID=126358 RepID=A0ABD1RQW2_9LAMI
MQSADLTAPRLFLQITSVLHAQIDVEPEGKCFLCMESVREDDGGNFFAYKEVVGAENIENKLASTEETTGFEEVGPTPGDVTENFSAEQRGPLLENIKTSFVIENLEGPPENKAMTVVLALSGQAEPTRKM